MSKRRMTTVVGLMLSTAMLVSACSSKTTDKPGSTPAPAVDPNKVVDGGNLILGEFSDIKTLNPMYADDTASTDLVNFVFAGLYDNTRNFDLEVNERTVAAALPEVSADGLTYTIKIKNNVKWSDGTPLTMEDVLFTYQMMRDPKAGYAGQSAYDTVKDIKKVDETTFQIILKEVDARFRYSLGIVPMPAKVFKDLKPEDYQANPFGKDPSKTIYSGPYVWKEWKEKQYNIVERNPNYWSKKANIQTITLKQYADQNTEIQALVAGEVDYVSAIPVATLPAVEGKPGLKTFEGLGQSYDYLMFNFKDDAFPQGKSPFHSAKTRQAIGFAINKKGMIDSVLKGHGVPQEGPFLSTSWANDTAISKGYPFNAATAKTLLAEDGWKAGADGILAKDGIKFEFDLITNSGNKRRESFMAIIQQNLADVGIKVNIKPLDFQAITGDITKKGTFQALLLGWSMNNPDPDKEGLFGTKQLPPTGQNYGSYSNTKMDQLWIDGYHAVDQAKRKAVYTDALKEMQADPAYIFLAAPNTIMGYKDNVHWADKDKPEPSVSTGYLYHAFDWWVTK
jgi:peptide/nickel transport system substrate-binding protein